MTGSGGGETGRSAGIVRHSAEVESREVAAGAATRVQILLGPADGTPNFAMRRFTMGAGGGMPVHTNSVEHEQYVLQGRAEVGIGGKKFEVGAGDVLYIPAGLPHHYRVIEAPFEFLCMVPNAEDRIDIIEDRGC
ncbi:MAG: cupin domain-containing protein [Acidobacteria bacterium]|nr:cupin domain-containing protein [Acidobacteriota bacterium]